MAKTIIGLVGEDPNDTDSIRNLISSNFPNVQFNPLLKRLNGSQLETPKAKKMLKVEYQDQQPKAVVFIRDLDGVRTEKAKVQKREEYFDTCNAVVDGRGLPLLNIYTLEALIYAEIGTFNSEYGAKVKFKGDPTMIENPKEKLKSQTAKGQRKYHESHNPSLFSKLNYNTVQENCSYFSQFIGELENKIKQK